jgi:hypothetical protein
MRALERKNWNNFFLGLAVAVLPFLGLPLGLKKIIFLVLGLLVAVFSLARLRRLPNGEASSPEINLPESSHESAA